MKLEIHNCNRCNRIIYIVDDDRQKKTVAAHGQFRVEGGTLEWNEKVQESYYHPFRRMENATGDHRNAVGHWIAESDHHWCVECLEPILHHMKEIEKYVSQPSREDGPSLVDSIVAAIEKPSRMRIT